MLDDENMEENYLSLDESIVDERAPVITISKHRVRKVPTLYFSTDQVCDG